MVQRNLSHECNILDDEFDKKFGYLTSHKYHEVIYNTTYIFDELHKEFSAENQYIDFLRLIFNTLIPKIKLDYSSLLDEDELSIDSSSIGSKNKTNTNTIIAKYMGNDGEYIEEPIIVKDEKLKDNLKYIIKDSYKHISAIIKIVMLNIVRLAKVFLNKHIEINNNKEKKVFEIYTEIFNKRRLWIELEYTLNNEKIVIYKVCKFAEKADGSKGIIPQILIGLLDARKKYKNEMEDEKDPFKKSILDGLQLAYKVTANSLYGQTGAPTSSIFMKDIAAATTATGRQMLQYSRYFIEEKFGPLINYALTDKKKYVKFANETFDLLPYKITSYGSEFKVHIEPNIKIPEKRWINPKAGYNNKDEFIEVFYKEMNKLLKTEDKKFSVEPKIIYGDSVMGYTPILCKLNDYIFYETIENLPRLSEWVHIDDKFFADPINNLEVWSDSGFTKIKKIIKHRTNKKIFRVITNRGLVDVTEDHSLLDKYGNSITPKDVLENTTELLHEKLPRVAFGLGKDLNTHLYYAKKYVNLRKNIKVKNQYIDLDKGSMELEFVDSYETTNYIEKIFELNSNNENYYTVYDLETENHHFAAGVGEIVVHNTDSVFFNPKITDIETGEVQKDKKSLEISIQLGLWASETICKLLPDPQKQAYEKVLYPFAILTKKRYVGNLYETDPTKYYQKSMGIVLKRRDNAPIVKVVVGGIINEIMNKRSAKGAVEYAKKTLKQILMDKYAIDKFIITKTLREKYADRTRIVHAVLADRMARRDPGNKPLPNDRIPYAYIQVDREVDLQGDRVEHPDFIEKNKLKLDYLFYITNQIMKPSIQFLELLVNNPETIFDEYILREQNRRKGFKPVNYFFKTTNNSEDKETINLEEDEDNLQEEVEQYKNRKKTKTTIKKIKVVKKVEEKSDSEEEFKL